MNYSTHKFYVKQAMRNQYLLIVFLLAGLLGYGQQYNYVSIDDTYTVDQLVKDVLVGADCDLVSNVTYQYCDGSPGSYDVYPLGYFNRNGSDFPFDEGIIISTDQAGLFEGPSTGYASSGYENLYRWTGDQDLNDLINDAGGWFPSLPNTIRSASIDFEFIPMQNTVTFEYLFGSNSYYGCYLSCDNAAMFGAWLIDTTTGVGENLAKIPNTNDPISIYTLRDGDKTYPSCSTGIPSSINETYFGNAYGSLANQIPPLSAPINLSGHTRDMTSITANVVVGRKYRIKLAIIDFCGTSGHTSAVFFKAGSFDIGNLDLGDSKLVVEGDGLCVGDSYTLKTGLDPLLFAFEWFKDDVLIPGATGADYVVTETGYYKVKGYIPNVTSCVMESEPVLIEFYDYVDLDQAPSNLQACPSAGVSTRFDLNDAMVGTTSGTNWNFSYYLSKSNADNDVNEISNFYDLANTATSRTIWVRVYELNNPCVYVTSFTLSFINCIIELNRLSDLTICEGDSVQTFDLTVQTPLVYNNASGYAVTYHLSQNDADLGQSAIPAANLASYNGADGERIWVRVTNSSNPQVYGVTSFYLFRYLLPQVQTNIPALTSCENGSSGLGDFNLNLAYGFIPVTPAGTSLEFYQTQSDALLGDASVALPSQYTGPAGTLYVRVRNLDGDCFVVVPLQLQLINAPVANPVGPISECDLNNDGFTRFNLDPYRVLIGGNPLPANGVISFHETQADADNNVNAIQNTGTYTNKVKDQQTIYARVGYTNSSCYSTVAITLIVNKTPAITPVGVMRICDIGNDNVETVDLTSNESVLLTGLTATAYTVTYHITSNAAMAGTGAIGNPSNFSTSISPVVYVRITDNITGCFAVTRIDLELVDLPVVSNPLPKYSLCDTNGNGFEVFDLASLIPGIVGSQRGLQVTFHYSNSDAEAGTPSLPLQYQNGSANLHPGYVPVFNPAPRHYVVTTLTLEDVDNPVLNMLLKTYVICSGSYGTINIFLYGKALVDATGENYTFSFYETESDAENEINQIANPIAYNNLQPGNPVVWIRVEDPNTDCYAVYPMAFQLVVPPVLPASLPALEECDVLGNRQDGSTLFDLTQQDAALIAAQTVTGTYQIRYFTSQALADSNTNWIADPTQFQNTSNPQTIWVRVEDTDLPGSCNRVMSFEIKVQVPHVLHQPLPIILCDTQLPNDGSREFDLRIREADILGGQFHQMDVTYHLTQQDAENGINKISDPERFRNTVNPQTVYVSVVNQYGCRSVITLTVRVLPLPEPNLAPDPLELCEDLEDAGPDRAIFDLTSAESNLSNYSDYNYSYFIDEIGAQTNDPGSMINNPTEHLSTSDTVYVRVVNNFTDTSMQCFTVVELPLIVHPTPAIGPMTNLAACMENPTPTTQFDLRDKDAQALAGANPDDYIVRYFGSEENAEDNINPLPYIYTNTTENRQQIWVRKEHKETGCFAVETFFIQIEQAVYAYRPSNTEFCETDYVNDGISLINLTVLDTEIIGNQPAPNLTVSYYRNDGTAIGTPGNVQVHHREVIRAEVHSTNPGLVCSSTVEFEVRLKEAPEVLPLEDGVVCYEYRDQWSIISGHYLDTGVTVTGEDYTFVWTRNGGAITPDVADVLDGGSRLFVKRGGSYRVVVTGLNGCTTMRDALVDEAPSITIDEVKVTDSFGDTNAIEVLAYAGDNYTLEYRLDDGPWQEENIFLDVTPGEHTVYVRIVGQPCEASKVIMIMDYPKYFTPNNDGYNDTWNIWSLKDQPNSKIYIFDRYGKLLKELSPAGAGWDGTFNGHPVPSTDYWFKAEYIDPKTGLQKEVTGHFSLKR